MNIEWPNFTGHELMWKWPEKIISYGEQCIVDEDQTAIVYSDKIYLELGPGRHILSLVDLPDMKPLISEKDDSKFVCEIYYVCTKEHIDAKFGTIYPISLDNRSVRSPQFKAFGTFSFKVVNPVLFITNFVVPKKIETSNEVENALKDFVIEKTRNTISTSKLQVVNVSERISELKTDVVFKLRKDLKDCGVEITKMGEFAIKLLENVDEI